MKLMKKLMVVFVALFMIMSMTRTVDAAGTGSITVKNATKGHTYTAYKVFDATYNGTAVSYKTPAANASLLDASLFGWSTAADSEGNITVWALEDASEEDILDWVEANYASFGGTAIPGEFDDANSTVTFSNLDFGYYYITSSLGSAVTIDSAVPDAEVYDKNEVTPTDPAKTIVSVDGKEVDNLKEADAHVGSVVGFKVTAKTTNWTGKEDAAVITEEWELVDTPSLMEINLASVVVKFNNTELTKDTDYTAELDSDGKLTINVPMVDDDGNSVFAAPVTEDEENGLIPIEVTYSATITADAGDNPAKNQIPGSNIEVFTYAFQVAKVDDKEQPLPGAQFELWSTKNVEDAEAAALTFIDNGDGTYTYSSEGTVTTLDMTTNTTIVVKGLDNTWSYTLKEITVPEGYNQVEDISIAGSSLTKVTEGMDTSISSTALYKETVVNKQGAVLPSTGGIGTTIFYVVGSALVLGAGIILVAKKRVNG